MSIELDGDDLRSGDILLVEAGLHPAPISRVVTVLDRSPYSHAVIVVIEGGTPWCYGANMATIVDDVRLHSGVNRCPVGWFSSTLRRPTLLLRHREAPQKADGVARLAAQWRDDAMNDRSDYALALGMLSGLAALSRQMEGGASRRALYRLAQSMAEQIAEQPCDQTHRGPVPGGQRAHFDCAHFVEHVFCAAGAPLGLVESDPAEGDPRASLREALRFGWEALLERLCPDHATATDPDLQRLIEANGWSDEIGPVLRSLLCKLHVSLSSLDLDDRDPPGRVWAPFASPRLIGLSPVLEVLGHLPAGAVPDPTKH